MECSTGLTVKQFADLVVWVGEELADHRIPPCLGLGRGVRACLLYLRHNLSQACIGQLMGGVTVDDQSGGVCAYGPDRPGLGGLAGHSRRDRPASVLRARWHAPAVLGLT